MRTRTSSLLIALLISISSAFPIHAQKSRGKEQEVDRIVVGTNEVVLDAVVKDKKGRPVKDLKASDFEVFEDGVPQQLKSFRLVTRDTEPQVTSNVRPDANANPGSNSSESTAANSPTPPRATAALGNTNRVGALALVFDRLSPDGRNIARQAAIEYLKGGMHANDFVGVFGIDLSL